MKFLVFVLSVLTCVMCVPGAQGASPFVVEAGLTDEVTEPVPSVASRCDTTVFTRNLTYAADTQNVLDVAAPSIRPQVKPPVLLFIANERFDSASDGNLNALVEQAMCFAANAGMVSVKVSYRAAPGARWPSAARDLAAAVSWTYENADLFGGDKDEIILVGYRAGAFHVASFLAHKELQDNDASVAGAVLLSGIYWPGKANDNGEQAYFGSDQGKFGDESIVSGLGKTSALIVLAWSLSDPSGVVDQGQMLDTALCAAGHCPPKAVLTNRASPVSVFDLDGAGDSLRERLGQLVGQIRVRGLP